MAIIRWNNGDPDTGEPFDIIERMHQCEGFEL